MSDLPPRTPVFANRVSAVIAGCAALVLVALFAFIALGGDYQAIDDFTERIGSYGFDGVTDWIESWL